MVSASQQNQIGETATDCWPNARPTRQQVRTNARLELRTCCFIKRQDHVLALRSHEAPCIQNEVMGNRIRDLGIVLCNLFSFGDETLGYNKEASACLIEMPV
eukprot:TRINITY_DN73037_c0_g1_i1.p3 TRINITY_DN73037_c0_g1~~TRINITY_DN73037_c0_g1_i1.p3  ORF type:complete len:102 (+),score=9.89 TRINITY_DN73037_c0_g1_i1:204-509(+)